MTDNEAKVGDDASTSPFAMRFPVVLWDRLGVLAIDQAAAARSREVESLNAMCNRMLTDWVQRLISGQVVLPKETPQEIVVTTKSYKGVTLRMSKELHGHLHRCRGDVSVKRLKTVSLNQLVAELLDQAWKEESEKLPKKA